MKVVKVMKKFGTVVTSIFLLLLIWQSIIWLGQYPEALLPSPQSVAIVIYEKILDQTLFQDIGISLFRFFVGYIIAVVSGIILGLILGRLPRIWSLLDPMAQLLRPISPIAWFPFIILWFGIGDLPAIVIIFIAGFFPVLLTTVHAVRKVDPIYLKVAANFEIQQTKLLTKVIFPASFPFIANGLHLALGSAWVFLVAGEMIGAQSGLGFLIVDARNSLSLDVVFAAIIVIGVLGLLFDLAIRYFETWIHRVWGGIDPKREKIVKKEERLSSS